MAGEPAPLNPQARADVNEALREGGADSLEPASPDEIVGGLSPAEQTPGLAEGLDKDSRVDTIKNELVEAWELIHGSRFDKQGILSGEFQDFLYGNPADQARGQEALSLNDRAREVFEERFPDDAKAYAEKERTRIYEDPKQDPALEAVEKEILRRTNADQAVVQARTNYGESWNRANQHQSMTAWDEFTRKYPEKAAAYKDRSQLLQQAFEGQDRLRRFQEQQAQAEAAKPKRLDDDPTFRDFIDNPQNGLNARVWADISVDQGLTSAQYLQRAEAIKPQMLAEFAAKHPDTYAKYNQGEITSGLSLPEGLEPSIQAQSSPDQPKPFDPSALIQMDSIGVDDFFRLDTEQVYNVMRRLVVNQDPNIRQKAERFLSLIELGRDNFINNNPGVTTINLTKP